MSNIDQTALIAYPLHKRRYVVFGGLLIGMAVLYACQKPTSINHPPTQNAPAHSVPMSSSNSSLLSTAAAANPSTKTCPKLLRRPLSGNVITYQSARTSGDCDYYFYPKIGERLSVSVSDPSLALHLVAPTIYNFDEGAFVVTEAGRYIIRVSPKMSEDKGQMHTAQSDYVLHMVID